MIVCCASGGRSALAGQALVEDKGYGEVYNLGGFEDWATGGGAIDAIEA